MNELKNAQLSTLTRPSRAISELRADDMLWLDKNENMDPEYLTFLQQLMVDLPSKALFGYPDCHALYQKLAAQLNVSINQLLISHGSDGIIRAVYEAFVAPGEGVLYTNPTFAMYEVYTKISGARAIELHYVPSPSGPVLTVEQIVNTIATEKPKLICIPNPNSPSGTVFSEDELITIIQTAKVHDAIILIDEAYHPFYAHTVLPFIDEYPNLIVARSFSKAWGCAGIRLGYSVTSAALNEALHKIRPMYEAGALSFTIAERLLDCSAQMLDSVKRLNEGKAYFLQEMQQLGFRTLVTEGNFLHVAFGGKATQIHQALSDKVLYRVNFSHPSLAGFSRFSATTKEVFAQLVDIIKTAVVTATTTTIYQTQE